MSQNRKISKFPANTVIPSDAVLTFVSGATNFKITLSDFLAALNVTGTIVQEGAVSSIPVLDTQGSVHKIRNLKGGTGIDIFVNPDNGITIGLTNPTGTQQIVTKSANYQAVAADDIIHCTGTFTVTLPDAADFIHEVTIASTTGTISLAADISIDDSSPIVSVSSETFYIANNTWWRK